MSALAIFRRQLAARMREADDSTRFEGEDSATFGASVPSADALESFADTPSLANAGKVAGSVAARAGIIGVGLLLAGERSHLVRNSVAGSLAIEGFLVGYLAFQRAKKGKVGT